MYAVLPPLPGDRPLFIVEDELAKAESVDAFCERLRRRVLEGKFNRIVLFQILDEWDYNAPWPSLEDAGLTKERLRQCIESVGQVNFTGEMAGIPTWELKIDHRTGDTATSAVAASNEIAT